MCDEGTPTQLEAPPNVVAPLSEVRTKKLVQSLRLPHDTRSLQAIQLQLLQDMLSISHIHPHLLLAVLARNNRAAQPSKFSAADRAATVIEAAARHLVARASLRRVRRAARRLQRWARNRSRRQDPPLLVKLRWKMALLPMFACACWTVALIPRTLSHGPFSVHSQEALTVCAMMLGLMLSCAARLRQRCLGHAIPDCAGISLVTAGIVFFVLNKAWAMTATTAAFERASQMGTKIANFGVLFWVLPGPAKLRLVCIAVITLADAFMLAQMDRALGIEPPAVPPEPLIFLLTACAVSYLSSAALHHVSQFEAAMGDLRQLVDARSLDASRLVDARVHQAWREGPLARIHLLAAQVRATSCLHCAIAAMAPACPRHWREGRLARFHLVAAQVLRAPTAPRASLPHRSTMLSSYSYHAPAMPPPWPHQHAPIKPRPCPVHLHHAPTIALLTLAGKRAQGRLSGMCLEKCRVHGARCCRQRQRPLCSASVPQPDCPPGARPSACVPFLWRPPPAPVASPRPSCTLAGGACGSIPDPVHGVQGLPLSRRAAAPRGLRGRLPAVTAHAHRAHPKPLGHALGKGARGGPHLCAGQVARQVLASPQVSPPPSPSHGRQPRFCSPSHPPNSRPAPRAGTPPRRRERPSWPPPPPCGDGSRRAAQMARATPAAASAGRGRPTTCSTVARSVPSRGRRVATPSRGLPTSGSPPPL